MRSRAITALLAGALIVTATGLALIWFSLPAGDTAVVTRGVPINRSATDPRDFSSHNSPTVARSPVDPLTMVVVNRIDAPVFSCALHFSSDGGATWEPGEIPFPAGEELPERCYAPDIAFAPDGTLYVSFVTLAGRGNAPNAGWVVSSTDGGRTLSSPAPALGPLAFQVQLAADPDTAGRLYVTWLQAEQTTALAFAEPGNPIMVARSDDGGATWSDAERVSSPSRSRVLAPSVAATGDTLHVLYLDVGDDVLDYHGGHEGRGGPPYPGRWSLVLASSRDAGTTWEEVLVDDEVVPTQRFIAFTPPTPSLAVDAGRERVYVGFHDGRLGDADVLVWASHDAGASFGRGTRVNDTTPADGTQQYQPALAVAPGGRLDVVYYDQRADPDGVMNEVSLQSSTNGASTFGSRLKLSDRSFDARIGPGSERDMTDLGSRLGLASTNDVAVAVWTDTRAGTEASAKQDLAQAMVVFTSPSSLRTVLPPLGVLVALSGVAIAVLSSRKPRPTVHA